MTIIGKVMGKVTPWGADPWPWLGSKYGCPVALSAFEKFSLYPTHLMLPERRRTV
jgi:hypothetical protein